jgi:hypothetical protein
MVVIRIYKAGNQRIADGGNGGQYKRATAGDGSDPDLVAALP